MPVNNYEKLYEELRLKSLAWDFKERYCALGLPGYNDKSLPITYYGVHYTIDRSDGRIFETEKPNKALDITTRLVIYHLFYYSKKNPTNTNNYIPLHELKRAAPFNDAFKKQTLLPFAKTFEGKTQSLLEAGEKLGFTRLSYSDAGFQAMAFSCIPIRFLFWDGDDEISAQANILFDENITDFTHEETVICLAANGVSRLVEAANLTLHS